MKSRELIRAIIGVVLCVIGFVLAVPVPSTFHEHRYWMNAGGCRMETILVERSDGVAHGTVILLHGLAADKKIMSYMAHGFAAQGLRVFVPDLPGHGRTPGPFSPARAQECSAALLREMLARGIVIPDRTILAGHSMGGAIAIRVADAIPVAGVIAISPAPMRAAYSVQPEMLLWPDLPHLPSNTLVFSGGMESNAMRGNAQDLVSTKNDGSSNLLSIPWGTHVGLLFDPRVLRASQEWTARLLHLSEPARPSSLLPLVGASAGFLGILLIAGPFLRETLGKNVVKSAVEKNKGASDAATTNPQAFETKAQDPAVGFWRNLIPLAAISLGVVGILKYWNPLRLLHLFEGDYLASFFLLSGLVLLLLHSKTTIQVFRQKPNKLLAAAFTALTLFLLITGWFDLTITGNWLTVARWMRFPLFLIALFPYHLAEELFLGPNPKASNSKAKASQIQRLGGGLLLRTIAWTALVLGVFILHSGGILFALMAPYFLLLFAFLRRGMDIVRQETGSAAAAALFGAILLAGFCLVIFPAT